MKTHHGKDFTMKYILTRLQCTHALISKWLLPDWQDVFCVVGGRCAHSIASAVPTATTTDSAGVWLQAASRHDLRWWGGRKGCMQGKFYQNSFLYILQSPWFDFRLLHVSSQWQQRRFVSEFNRFCSINRHFSILVHHCPLNCVTALTRQRIIKFSVLKFMASSQTQQLAGYWVSKLGI